MDSGLGALTWGAENGAMDNMVHLLVTRLETGILGG